MTKVTEVGQDLSISSVTKDSSASVQIDFSVPSGMLSKPAKIQSLSFATSENPAGQIENEDFYAAGGRSAQLASIMMSLAAGDVAILGGRGVGKQTIARECARILGQKIEPVLLYQGNALNNHIRNFNLHSNRPVPSLIWALFTVFSRAPWNEILFEIKKCSIVQMLIFALIIRRNFCL